MLFAHERAEMWVVMKRFLILIIADIVVGPWEGWNYVFAHERFPDSHYVFSCMLTRGMKFYSSLVKWFLILITANIVILLMRGLQLCCFCLIRGRNFVVCLRKGSLFSLQPILSCCSWEGRCYVVCALERVSDSYCNQYRDSYFSCCC